MRKQWFLLSLLGLEGCNSGSEPIIVASAPKPAPAPTAQPTHFAPLPPIMTPTPAPLSAQQVVDLQEAQKIEAADPLADLEKAWQQGDYRFAVVQGEGGYAPGLKKGLTATLMNQYGAKTICAPGDVNLSEEEMRLWRAGVKYATSYNQALSKKLKID